MCPTYAEVMISCHSFIVLFRELFLASSYVCSSLSTTSCAWSFENGQLRAVLESNKKHGLE